MMNTRGPISSVLWEHGHSTRPITENRVGPANLSRRQGPESKWDSATSQMTRPGQIIIVSEATKHGEGVFSRQGSRFLPFPEFLVNQKFFPVYRVI